MSLLDERLQHAAKAQRVEHGRGQIAARQVVHQALAPGTFDALGGVVPFEFLYFGVHGCLFRGLGVEVKYRHMAQLCAFKIPTAYANG